MLQKTRRVIETPVPGSQRYDSRPATGSEKPRPKKCTTSLYPENPMIMVDLTPPGITRYGNNLFLLISAYGYSRPRLSIRDIITQCGYSVRYRPQASPLQGNAGRVTSCFPESFTKHHRDISFWLRLSSMQRVRRTVGGTELQ